MAQKDQYTKRVVLKNKQVDAKKKEIEELKHAGPCFFKCSWEVMHPLP